MEMDYKNPRNNQQLTGMLKNQEANTLAGENVPYFAWKRDSAEVSPSIPAFGIA